MIILEVNIAPLDNNNNLRILLVYYWYLYGLLVGMNKNE